jgi:ABC-type amino acid transport substrate-binding protein
MEGKMSIDEQATEAKPVNREALPSRRSLLKLGGSAALGLGAYALAACETSNSSPGTTAGAAGESSVLDKWLSTKTAKLGVDLTFPPIQFKDSNGKPTGYQMELTEAMMADLGVTPTYVEIPFGQLFAGLVAGKFDMMGISATILPSRALKGLFSNFPVFYESIVVLLNPSSNVTTSSQLDGKKIAVLQGSSQEFSSKLLFPNATFSPFAQLADAVNEVATGRADATVLSEFDVDDSLKAHPNLKLLSGPPLWVDANTYLMPLGDYKLQAWVNNWLRYNATHQRLTSLWKKWLGPGLQKYKLLTYGVGPGTEPEVVTV